MPGPRPTPTYLKLLRGNPGRRPINKNEPKPEIPAKQPAPPAWLSAYALEEWQRLAPELWRINLLTKVDVAVFAMYCEAYARWRTAEEALALMASKDPVMQGLIVRSKAGTAMENPLAYISRRAAQGNAAVRQRIRHDPGRPIADQRRRADDGPAAVEVRGPLGRPRPRRSRLGLT